MAECPLVPEIPNSSLANVNMKLIEDLVLADIQRRIDQGFINEKFEPLICTECLGFKFEELITDRIDYTPCEMTVVCADCGSKQGYWAYGSFQP